MTDGSQFQTAADGCTVQRRDHWHTAAADHREDSVPGSGVVERLRRVPSAVLGEVKAGAKAGAMTEYHQRPSLLLNEDRTESALLFVPDDARDVLRRRIAD